MNKIILSLVGIFLLSFIFETNAQDKPNVVLIFPDNLGVGEVSAYGGARGVPTPNRGGSTQLIMNEHDVLMKVGDPLT